MGNKHLKINDTLTREINLNEQTETRAIDEENRTVEIAFSSETPVERFFGEEILDHSPQSVKLDRLNNGGAVLVEHERADQVGVIENARIDKDKVGRATLRFSKSKRGREIFQDVIDGIRSLVSVGYRVHEWKEKKVSDGFTRATAISWTPHEISLVSIPADASVGVGRSENSVKNKLGNTKMTDSKNKTGSADVKKIAEKTRSDELKRIDAIRQMAEEHDFEALGRKAIEENTEVSTFYRELLEKVGERNNKIRAQHEDETGESIGALGLSDNDRNQFSVVRLMDALGNRDDRAAQKAAGFELEVIAESERTLPGDYKVRGNFITNEVLGFPGGGQRDLSVGTATAGGNLVGTDLLGGSFIELLRNQTVTAQAGAQFLPGLVGNVDIPRQDGGASITWISAEDGDATESDPTFTQVSLSPKDAAAFTEVTRRLTLQSSPAIEGIVRADLAAAVSVGIDAAVLNGSGASGQPTGIANTTGVNSFTFAAADPTYAEITRMIKEVMIDNAFSTNGVFVIDPEGWDALSVTPRQASGVEGNFILGQNEKIKGRDYFVTNQVTAEDYFFGDFSQVVIGEWGGLEINVDPYTNALKGRTRFIIYKTVDVGVRQPGAFCHANDTV